MRVDPGLPPALALAIEDGDAQSLKRRPWPAVEALEDGGAAELGRDRVRAVAAFPAGIPLSDPEVEIACHPTSVGRLSVEDFRIRARFKRRGGVAPDGRPARPTVRRRTRGGTCR